ncbi:sulfatase [Prosthecobacter sp. SYSU 5D2]|uniref:sulfatase n=1 Tax=Prosthecobacter sp. SYSU 5D2 TaxID=3134134 RepID=UPI0031FEA2E1
MFARITTCLLFVSASLLCAAPNVLFIAVDDLRPELGCYGTSFIQSPNIDKLAASSVLFDRAYCQVAVCNPSRNSVLSGFRSDTTTILANNTYLRPALPDVVTLPQHFKNHGYTSLSLGKIFHHSQTEPGDDPQSWSEPSWYQGQPYRHWFTKESEDFIKEMKQRPKKDQPRLIRAKPYEAANEPDDVYPDGQTALKAIETLQRLKSEGKPFFLGVGFVKPHLPFTCPQKYWDLYPEDSIRMPENSAPPEGVPSPALHDLYELRSYGGIPRTGDIDEATALKLIRAYRACVSFMDAQLGRVIDELDRLGLRENTIIVLWGDHGYHLGEQGLFTKMTNFELGTRVPLLVSAPGMKAPGQKSRALVELVDLYPTLAELAGLPVADSLEGSSLAPLLDTPDRPWKKAAFSVYLRRGPEGYKGRSIRTDRWRYTEWKTPKGKDAGTELYDHDNDPKETVNLAADAKHAETVQQLSAQLAAGWKEAVPAP